jgi:hypothetical protein
MANSCYNLLEIWGNAQVIEQVREWNKALDTVDVPSEDVHRMGATRRVFFPGTPDTQPLDLGSKWVHPDSESTGSDDESLGLQSAWCRPEELEKRIACLLFQLDPNVFIRNSFNIDDGTEGIAYTLAISATEAVSVEASANFNFDDLDEDDVEAEEESRREEYQEEATDLISDLVYSYPHVKSTVKAHQLELGLDDEFFED